MAPETFDVTGSASGSGDNLELSLTLTPVAPTPAPEPEPDPVPTAMGISQFGITWLFDGEYEYGQFANGDYWVIGPVTIQVIEPKSTEFASEVGDRTMNGSMLNPSPTLGQKQGYDSHIRKTGYLPELNVALDVSPENPLVLQPGSSLVSTISNPVSGPYGEKLSRPQLTDAAVLTVLAERPPEGSFRPPYSGTDKTIEFNKSDLDYSILHRLPPVDSAPTLSQVSAKFERPWLDHLAGWQQEWIHPSNNMPSYGREFSSTVGDAALMLQLDFSEEEKEELLIRLVQLGIDLFGIVKDGGENVWEPNGGVASGRKFPILFAGMVLHDESMTNIGQDKITYFGEDAQTFYVEETAPGIYNYGDGGYSSADEGLAEWGQKHGYRDRLFRTSLDNKDWGASYRSCCTANSWGGWILATRILGAVGLWNHPPLFDYYERYVAQTVANGGESMEFWLSSGGPFARQMWERYRPEF